MKSQLFLAKCAFLSAMLLLAISSRHTIGPWPINVTLSTLRASCWSQAEEAGSPNRVGTRTQHMDQGTGTASKQEMIVMAKT